MFTGIITKTSKVKNTQSTKDGLVLQVVNNLGKIKKGDSISLNGVCSTVKSFGKYISFEYMPETLKLSNMGHLKSGSLVNLEQSLRMRDRLDGHVVLGHIDGRGVIGSIKEEGNSKVFEIKVPSKKFMKFLVYKGSIAVEGISLTVAKISGSSFVVKIIPYTLEHTNLRFKKVGDVVNLEFDILAKYVSRTKFLTTGYKDKN